MSTLKDQIAKDQKWFPLKVNQFMLFTRPPSPLCLKQPSSVLTAVSLQRNEGDDACAPHLPLFLPASGREKFRDECWRLFQVTPGI